MTRILMTLLFAGAALGQTQSVVSPDAQLQLSFALGDGGQLTYEVTYR
jgi:hypothetical protein